MSNTYLNFLIAVLLTIVAPPNSSAAQRIPQIETPSMKTHAKPINSIVEMMTSGNSVSSLFGGIGSFDFFGELTAEQQKDAIDRAYPDLAAKWENSFIFVCWKSSMKKFKDDRALVRKAIRNSWEAASALRFPEQWVQCSDNSRGIRIAVQDTGPHSKALGKFLDSTQGGMVLKLHL